MFADCPDIYVSTPPVIETPSLPVVTLSGTNQTQRAETTTTVLVERVPTTTPPEVITDENNTAVTTMGPVSPCVPVSGKWKLPLKS